MYKLLIKLLKVSLLYLLVSLSACVGVPDGIMPVSNFDINSYLGTWYEIARLDNRFEEGMSQVTANYSRNLDGSIRVTNRGYLNESQSWDEAIGKAEFVNNDDLGHLKVSFFGPFYASYVIFHLSDDSSQSYVTSNDRDYLWFLSRSPIVDDASKTDFIDLVRAIGFAYQDILWIDQTMNTE
jgi:apolipoprotein D and lipocalin family protein